MAEYKRTKAYRDLRKSLEDNLAARGLIEPIYQDAVERYLNYREMEYNADQNIAENGLNIIDERRGSLMANPCIATKFNAGRQASAIFRDLGFAEAARKPQPRGDDDDEL